MAELTPVEALRVMVALTRDERDKIVMGAATARDLLITCNRQARLAEADLAIRRAALDAEMDGQRRTLSLLIWLWCVTAASAEALLIARLILVWRHG